MTATAQAKAIKERPIIYTGQMVRQILADLKTNTRRIAPVLLPGIDKNYIWSFDDEAEWAAKRAKQCRYGQPGDRLWVRETWRKIGHGANGHVEYRADYDGKPAPFIWKSPIFMPRWASRIDLEITKVRVEKLHDITEEDAKAEGVEVGQCATLPGENPRHALCIHCHKRGNEHVGVSRACFGRSTCFNPRTYKGGFALLWDQINGKKAPWESNPFVWVIEFRRVK